MSAYREFTGKSVEEALKNAREAFGAGLDDLDFEILTPGSRGVLGMGAEPAASQGAGSTAFNICPPLTFSNFWTDPEGHRISIIFTVASLPKPTSRRLSLAER